MPTLPPMIHPEQQSTTPAATATSTGASLELELRKDLDDMNRDFANRLETLDGGDDADDDGSDGGEFSLAELETLMSLHDVREQGE